MKKEKEIKEIPGFMGKLVAPMHGSGVGNLIGSMYDEEERKKAAGAVPIPGMKKGGKVGSASKRADGCAMRGKTRGRMM